MDVGMDATKPYLKTGMDKGKGKGWGWIPQPMMMMLMQKGFGKGWKGKGKGGGSGGKKVPEDFTVPEGARFQGTVTKYSKWSGFGFIELSQKDLVPDDKIFVYWKSIKTDDRFPSLVNDMVVEFGIHKTKGNTVHAKEVTLPGGGMIAVQDQQDAEKKTFIGGQNLRYTGVLKFYNPTREFGYITMDDGYALSEPVPKDIRVEKSEINAGGRQPAAMKELQVEFGIWKTPKGVYKAYNMTLPGGNPVTKELLENRQVTGARTFSGEVEVWNWQKGWGFIKVPPGTQLPANVTAKIQQMNQAATEKGKSVSEFPQLYFRRSDIRQGVQLEKGAQVQFQIYTDDKGAGACDIFI